MQFAHDVGHVTRADGNLGRIAALANRPTQLVAEGLLEVALKPGVRSRASFA
jgi:hypothetical protein